MKTRLQTIRAFVSRKAHALGACLGRMVEPKWAAIVKGTVLDRSGDRYISGAKRVRLHQRVRNIRKSTVKTTLHEKGLSA